MHPAANIASPHSVFCDSPPMTSCTHWEIGTRADRKPSARAKRKSACRFISLALEKSPIHSAPLVKNIAAPSASMATRTDDGAMSDAGCLYSLNISPFTRYPSASSATTVNARKHDTENAATNSSRGGRSCPMTSARRLSISTAHPASTCRASRARAPSAVANPAPSSSTESAARIDTYEMSLLPSRGSRAHRSGASTSHT
mmetsp:Transcript_1362/g.5572  ORF Transcript_1362/g.5572 Transcript_1362/m.5572 type:complete len:201 (-) Transcript_1362:44-646(-)